MLLHKTKKLLQRIWREDAIKQITTVSVCDGDAIIKLRMQRDSITTYLFIIQFIYNFSWFACQPSCQNVWLSVDFAKVAQAPVPRAWNIRLRVTQAIKMHMMGLWRPSQLNAAFIRSPPRLSPFQKQLAHLTYTKVFYCVYLKWNDDYFISGNDDVDLLFRRLQSRPFSAFFKGLFIRFRVIRKGAFIAGACLYTKSCGNKELHFRHLAKIWFTRPWEI